MPCFHDYRAPCSPEGSGFAARFIWPSEGRAGRNAFVLFKREFQLEAVPKACFLHLFADTRYRLLVNGEYLGSGPARFVTSNPEYDSYDMSGALRPGLNVLVVEVNYYGAPSYQTMPDSMPGFIAWGTAGGLDLSTPGEWYAARHCAWRHDAPLFSFAQGPVEICDTRLLDSLEFERPVVLPDAVCPWGPLRPYSGRDFVLHVQRPSKIEVAGRLKNTNRILAVMARDPDYDHQARNSRPKLYSAFATWIRSPCPQKVGVGCFWTELLINGHKVSPLTDVGETPFGNHQLATLELAYGWNLLTGTFQVLAENWACLLSFPRDAGISMHGLPEMSCALPIAMVGSVSQDPPELPQPGDSTLPDGWVLTDGLPPNLTPARVVAWDCLGQEVCRGLSAAHLEEMSPVVAEEAVWCLRFDGEFLGYPVIEVEAPEGTVLDVACDDWLTPGGTVAVYQSNPFTDTADRFLLRGGRQKVELFHMRGGKYLQVTLRTPGNPAPLSLHRVFVRSRQTLGPCSAKFECGERALDWSFWNAATTLAVSTASAYSDCPWRERGMYLGDALVNMHLDLLLYRDPRTARRMIRQFAQAQREDGLLPACAPAWLRYAFGDYTLLWILALRDYWAITGDKVLVDEVWPALKAIWASPAWKTQDGVLWDAGAGDLFVDWGALVAEKQGRGNAVLNILRKAALEASAEMATARGLLREAGQFRLEATFVENAIFSNLWISSEERIAPSEGAESPALHANILALCFGLGARDQREKILKTIEPALVNNFSHGIANGQHSGHVELYFFYFLLPALANHGRPDLAEKLISQHYGYLQSLGDDTLPECFCRVHRSVGSRCHSWSGAPAIYAVRHVLGIRPAEPGNPGRLVFGPQTHNIKSASGRIAHPFGMIDVTWQKQAGGLIAANISTPPGVGIVADPGTVIRQPPGTLLAQEIYR